MESLTLDNFRGFEKFSMEGLRRVNLLVGTNNSGKTSVLEAIQLLCAEGDPSALLKIMIRRGEQVTLGEDNPRRRQELDVRHLFRGHVLDQGDRFAITSSGARDERWISYEVKESTEDDFLAGTGTLFDVEDIGPLIGDRLVLKVDGDPVPPASRFVLSRRGGLPLRAFDRGIRHRNSEEIPPVRFIGTESFGSDYLRMHWSEIALTQYEEFVIEALRILEPEVERIAFVGTDQTIRRGTSHGGVLVKLAGMASPVPIGSMGEGMWRLLVLAICVARSAGGTLLVDEIDTGLHHTVIADMWKLVVKTAERLDVQIFATTHSLDCVRSLAAVIRNEEIPADSVCIQRIEKEMQQSVRYSDREIVIAAERDTELR